MASWTIRAKRWLQKQNRTSVKRTIPETIFIVISTTLILFVLLELSAFIFSVVLNHEQVTHELTYPYNATYYNAVAQEDTAYKHIFCPYVHYCSPKISLPQFSGPAPGERTTINPCENATTVKTIFVFGGSTTICEQVFDQDTWASKLSQKLCAQGVAVRVRNFGQAAYVNEQEVVKLMLLLRNGEHPDYVIFLDGYNDYCAAYLNGHSGSPQNEAYYNFSYRLTNDQNFFGPFYLSAIAKGTRYVSNYYNFNHVVYTQSQIDELSRDIRADYVNNARIVQAVGREMGFTAFFFWQPTIGTKRQVSDYERSFSTSARLSFTSDAGYANTTLFVHQIPHFTDLD